MPLGVTTFRLKILTKITDGCSYVRAYVITQNCFWIKNLFFIETPKITGGCNWERTYVFYYEQLFKNYVGRFGRLRHNLGGLHT